MWEDIPNWEGLYQINEYGEVKNLKTNKYITGDINSAGYYRITLYHKNKKERFFRHRLVAMLFLDNPDNLPEVNHKNGDKSKNHYTNLEWCSRKYNEREAHLIGLKEYKPFKVTFDNNIVKTYSFAIDLANELGVTKRTIQNWLQGKNKGYIKYKIIKIYYVLNK